MPRATKKPVVPTIVSIAFYALRVVLDKLKKRRNANMASRRFAVKNSGYLADI